MQSSQINESAKGVNVFFKYDHQVTKLYMTYATHLKTVLLHGRQLQMFTTKAQDKRCAHL